MVEVTNELIYEVLKKLQEDVARIQTDLKSVREELGALRGHQLAMQKDIHNLYDLAHDTNRRGLTASSGGSDCSTKRYDPWRAANLRIIGRMSTGNRNAP